MKTFVLVAMIVVFAVVAFADEEKRFLIKVRINLLLLISNLYFFVCFKGSSHYLGGKIEFDVSSESPSSGIPLV